MRGKGMTFMSSKIGVGITPAYAGKSDNRVGEIAEWEDHPRLCGEKGRVAAGVVAVSGSPPPMRGKAFTAFAIMSESGITPAYAGKSSPLNLLFEGL